MASTADRVSAVFGRLAQVTPGDGVVCTGAMTMLMKEMGASDKKAAKEAKATLGKTGQATVAELVSGQFGQFLLVDKPQNLAKLEKLEATLAAMTLHHDFDGCEDKKADDEGVGVLAEAAAAEAKAEADAAKVEADAAAAKAEADAAKAEADAAKAEEEKAASEAKEAADKLAADTAEAEKTAAADAAAAAEAIEAKAKEEADAAATAKAAEVEAKHAADAVEAAEAKAKEDADAAEAKSKEEADAKSAADAAAAEAAEAEVAAAAAVAEEKAASVAKEAEEAAAAAAAEAVETKAKEDADAAATAKAAEAEEKCAADAAEAKSKADAEASAAVDAAAAEVAAPVDDGFEDAVSGMSIKDLKKTIIEAYLTLDGCYEKSDLRHRAVEGLRKQAAENGVESKGSTPSSPKFKRKRYTVLFEAFPIGFGIHATDEDGHVGVSSVAAGGKAAAANVRKNDVVAFVNYADMEGQTAKEVLTTLKACAKSKKPLAITFEKVVAHDGF